MHINLFNLPIPSPGKPLGAETDSDPFLAGDVDFAAYVPAAEMIHTENAPAPNIFTEATVDTALQPHADDIGPEKGLFIKEQVILPAQPKTADPAKPFFADKTAMMGVLLGPDDPPIPRRIPVDSRSTEDVRDIRPDAAFSMVAQSADLLSLDSADRQILLGIINLQTQPLPHQATSSEGTPPLLGGQEYEILKATDGSFDLDSKVIRPETGLLVPKLQTSAIFPATAGIAANDQRPTQPSVATGPRVDRLTDLATATEPQIRSEDVPVSELGGPLADDAKSQKQPYDGAETPNGMATTRQDTKQALNANSNQKPNRTLDLSETALPQHLPIDPLFSQMGAPRGEASFVAAFQLHATNQTGDKQSEGIKTGIEIQPRAITVNSRAVASQFQDPKAVDPSPFADLPTQAQDDGRTLDYVLDPRPRTGLVERIDPVIEAMPNWPRPSTALDKAPPSQVPKVPIPAVIPRGVASDGAMTPLLPLVMKPPLAGPTPHVPPEISAGDSDLVAINLSEKLATQARSVNTLHAAASAHDLRTRDHAAVSPTKLSEVGVYRSSMPVDLPVTEGIGSDTLVVGGGGAHGTMVHPTTATTVSPLPVVNQVAQGLQAFVQQDTTDRLQLSLNPEELGRLRFEMTTVGEKLHIIVYVERSETMDLLRRHVDHLLNDLRQSGLGQTSLSFGSWSQGGQAKGDRAPVHETTDTTEISGSAPNFSTFRQISADGRLDLRL